MARKLLKRMMPNTEMVKNHPSLQRFKRWLHDANLWHLNRYSASMAVFIGVFSALIPIPTQLPIAVLLAVWWRANLPISAALVWLTNPLTSPPIYFATYKFGSFLLQRPPHALNFEPSLEWLSDQIGLIWAPLLLGSLCAGVLCGLLGAILVRVLWRVQVGMRWSARRRHRSAR